MQDTADRGISSTVRGAATKLDEQGKRLWNERGPEARGGSRRFGYLMGAFVNAVLLYVVNSPLIWRIPFLTDDFASVLPIMELSLTATMVAYLAFIVYDGAWFRHLVRVGLSAIAFVTTYAILTVFPFDFPTSVASDAVSFGLTIALVCIAIATVVELCQFLFGWIRR